MNLKAIIVIVSVAFCSILNAQKAEISFSKEVHDFGLIKEANGPTTCTFQFTNIGKAPLVVQNVEPSCGCTTPEWTQAPIMPGKTGFIKATYDPVGRAQPFDKTITVTSNSEKNAKVILRIKGDVEAKPVLIQDQYPFNVGSLKLKSDNVNFGNMDKDTKTQVVEMINTAKTPLIVNFENVPSHISVKAMPVSVPAGQKGNITFVYNAGKSKEVGYSEDNITIKAGGQKSVFKVKSNLKIELPNLPAGTEPELNFSTSANRVNTKRGEIVKNTIVVYNLGKSDLVIKKIISECDCITANIVSNTIKPGEKTELELTVNTGNLKGKIMLNTHVISNSPKNSDAIIYTMGEVN